MASDTGIFIFRRDFRIHDNIGLHELSKVCKRIIPIFIFTPEQITDKNKFRSTLAIQFMIEALDDLASNISMQKSHLYCFMGENANIITSVLKHTGAKHIGFNRDYTPYAFKRDREIQELCKKLEVQCHLYDDYYLFPPGTLTKNGYVDLDYDSPVSYNNYYRKFTPFYEKAIENSRKMRKSVPVAKHLVKMTNDRGINTVLLHDMYIRYAAMNPNAMCKGGRRYALDAISNAQKTQRRYSETRDLLSHPTTLLSPYIKFGCVSIGEVAQAFRNNRELFRQLVWREYYAHTLFVFPEVLDATQYVWTDSAKKDAYFKAWREGNTGVPVVDACMRELNKTGYMHNRGRLIVASFLTKTLGVDWRMGERYFAQHLLDYDVASNNGNWRWIASAAQLRVSDGSTVHLDTQPPFRTFNPWIQAKKSDPHAEYIKKWVPELSSLEPNAIHKWNRDHDKYAHLKYPKPII